MAAVGVARGSVDPHRMERRGSTTWELVRQERQLNRTLGAAVRVVHRAAAARYQRHSIEQETLEATVCESVASSVTAIN